MLLSLVHTQPPLRHESKTLTIVSPPPKPNCPWSFLPHPNTSPSLVSAKQNACPACRAPKNAITMSIGGGVGAADAKAEKQ